MEEGDSFMQTLTSGLDNMLTTGRLADVTIVVSGKVFPCHKVVLSAMSPYFQAMFTHDMRESRDGIVTLYDVDSDIFESLLKFMYLGMDVVRVDNAESIFRASSLLHILCLQSRCEQYLLNQVSHGNCIGIWKIAKMHNCDHLAKKSFFTIIENFAQVVSTDEFEQLDVDDLISIIEREELAVKSEESVCDAVVTWIKADLDSRRRHVGRLLEVMRLPLVSSDFLFHLFDDECFAEVSFRNNAFVMEAFKFHSCPAQRPHFTTKRASQRRNGSRDDVFIFIGGLLKTMPRFHTTKEVMCYSLQQKKWFYLPPLPYDPGYEFAVCSYGADIFVSGGWLKLQGMLQYNVQKNMWKIGTSMANGRCSHVMVALKNSIYVIGGRDRKTPAVTGVEEYNLQTCEWRHVGDLLIGIRSMSASALGEKLFVFGGITNSERDTDAIQVFDTRSETSSIIGDLPFSCRLSRSIGFDDHVFIILPDGRIIRFDGTTNWKSYDDAKSEGYFSGIDSPSSDTSFPRSRESKTSANEHVLGKVVCKIPMFNQHHFEAVQHEGLLYLAGGKSPDNIILKGMLVLNPMTGEQVNVIQMPSPRWCFGCVKVTMTRDHLNHVIYTNKASL
ncbi:hypothetical protein ACJMK2_009357 [Sinanodonta woodiana]|uniref:BTB domain-containing protein n=1 Tax=Sinanodonta woodiana TaxID=1069815 RepID=A0ABD3VC99_SINWO